MRVLAAIVLVLVFAVPVLADGAGPGFCPYGGVWPFCHAYTVHSSPNATAVQYDALFSRDFYAYGMNGNGPTNMTRYKSINPPGREMMVYSYDSDWRYYEGTTSPYGTHNGRSGGYFGGGSVRGWGYYEKDPH